MKWKNERNERISERTDRQKEVRRTTEWIMYIIYWGRCLFRALAVNEFSMWLPIVLYVVACCLIFTGLSKSFTLKVFVFERGSYLYCLSVTGLKYLSYRLCLNVASSHFPRVPFCDITPHINVSKVLNIS